MKYLRTATLIAFASILGCSLIQDRINPKVTPTFRVVWKSGAIRNQMDPVDFVRITLYIETPPDTQPFSTAWPNGEVVFENIAVDSRVLVRLDGLDSSGSTLYSGVTGPYVMNQAHYDLYLENGAVTPLPPDSMRISLVPPDRMAISWRDNSMNETGFIVERRNAADSFDFIGQVPKNTMLYIDTGLSPQSVYAYRVRSFDTMGISPALDTVVDSTPAPPPKTPFELDTLAIRSILDTNGIHAVSVNQVCAMGTYGGEARVTELRLQRSRMSAGVISTLPGPALGRLRGLTYLQFDSNQVTVLPAEICSLSNLKTLNAEANLLTALPEEIGSLSALVTLRIQSNRLTVLPASIGLLTGLRSILTNDNQLAALPDSLAHLDSLTYIDFDGNRICSLSQRIVDWLTAIGIYDPAWKDSQTCP